MEAAAGWIAFQVIGTFVALAALRAGGWDLFTPDRPGGNIGRAAGQIQAGLELADNSLPVLVQFATLAPGWIALLGGSWVFATILGRARPGWRIEFRPQDVPIGVAAGALLQVPVIPVLYFLIEEIFGDFAPSVRAQTLIERVDSPLKVAALVAFVGIGAPVVEELFYRGLVQQSLVDRFGPAVGVISTGLIFGAVHFSLIELPALAVAGVAFGALYHYTGRLATPILAHVTFNLFTILVLLW